MVKIEEYNLPDDLYYTDRNLWVKLESEDTISIGFNDLAAKSIGKIAFIRLLPKGRAILKDKFLGSVESAKWVERLRSPVTGTITEVNGELRRKPKMVTDDPYGTWLVQIKSEDIARLQEELVKLIHGEAIKPFMEDQIAKLFKK
jgi:glycine cleavage system H protein